MKNVVLYIRRNTGLIALAYLWPNPKWDIKVISDDENILWFCREHGIEVTDFENMGDYDLLLCVHGNKILNKKYLKEGRAANVHPCLFKYRGANPVKRYILGRDTVGSVESQYMIEEVDAGEVIHQEFFATPQVNDHAGFYNIAMPYYIKTIQKTIEKLGI